MSVTEDDVELRDLVVQTLESNGILGKIKVEELVVAAIAVVSHLFINSYC